LVKIVTAWTFGVMSFLKISPRIIRVLQKFINITKSFGYSSLPNENKKNKGKKPDIERDPRCGSVPDSLKLAKKGIARQMQNHAEE
jgi:hypothetical protein